ncbi:RNB domain-containing ribonuclease [Propionibacteriaceae bacterium G1746]
MPVQQVRVDDHDLPEPIRQAFEDLRDELGVPTAFPADVLAEVDEVVARGYDTTLGHEDLTSIPFVTIDPPSSMDLDQALHIERDGSGYVVHYAIADVAAWVRPGGAIDAEAHRRGQTHYAPHVRYSLHPPTLSEGAASLLDDGVARPAQVWRMQVAEDGSLSAASVRRGLVTSTAKLDYASVQADIDAGRARESLMLLREVGQLRARVEADRGGVSLNLPDQEVHVEDGTWALEYREGLPVEDWNAQISLMTGMAAASMMIEGGVGILRTLPPADARTIKLLRSVAHRLGLPWAADVGYAEFVRALDVTNPAAQAMMLACVRLFRGAGYTVVVPGLAPDQRVHGALAAEYAHTTAPLRRLVDRYVGEICLALSAGGEVPEWAVAELDELPETMKQSDRRAKSFERGINDLVEALTMQHRVGERFTGVVLQVDEKRPDEGVLSLAQPAVEGPVRGRRLQLGAEIEAQLVKVDVARGKVEFKAV